MTDTALFELTDVTPEALARATSSPRPSVGVGSHVTLPNGDKGLVVCEIPSFGLLWLVKVPRRVGFELITARGSSLGLLS